MEWMDVGCTLGACQVSLRRVVVYLFGTFSRITVRENVFRRYDSFSGMRSSQKSIAFEKGSILFNIGILYAQKGSRRVRTVIPYFVYFFHSLILPPPVCSFCLFAI